MGLKYLNSTTYEIIFDLWQLNQNIQYNSRVYY